MILFTGGVFVQGISVQGGSLSREIPVQGVSVRKTPSTVMCRQYAPYWNAFLFLLIFSAARRLFLCNVQKNGQYHKKLDAPSLVSLLIIILNISINSIYFHNAKRQSSVVTANVFKSLLTSSSIELPSSGFIQ